MLRELLFLTGCNHVVGNTVLIQTEASTSHLNALESKESTTGWCDSPCYEQKSPYGTSCVCPQAAPAPKDCTKSDACLGDPLQNVEQKGQVNKCKHLKDDDQTCTWTPVCITDFKQYFDYLRKSPNKVWKDQFRAAAEHVDGNACCKTKDNCHHESDCLISVKSCVDDLKNRNFNFPGGNEAACKRWIKQFGKGTDKSTHIKWTDYLKYQNRGTQQPHWQKMFNKLPCVAQANRAKAKAEGVARARRQNDDNRAMDIEEYDVMVLELEDLKAEMKELKADIDADCESADIPDKEFEACQDLKDIKKDLKEAEKDLKQVKTDFAEANGEK